MNAHRALPLLLALAGAACATGPRGNPSYLAKVNDEVITGDDLRQEFSRHHAAMEKVLGDRPEVEKYLDRLIDRRLFIQEGKAMGIEDLPDVKEELNRFEASEISKALLKEELASRSSVSDDEVKGAFAFLSERMDIRQFVAPTREQAEAALAEVRKGGDLEAIVRARSSAQSAIRGGMTIVRWGADEAREKAVTPLKAGEMTGVYQSAEGWEFDRMERRAPYQMMGMDKAANFIRSTLERRKKTAAEDALRAALRASHEARIAEPGCALTLASLEAAAAKDDPTPCATWKEGQLTASGLAKGVHVDQLQKAPEDYPRNRAMLVDDFLDRALLEAEARARGYAARPEIAAKVRRYQDDLVESKLFAEWIAKKVQVTDDEVKAFYEANLARFEEPKRFHVAQVVVGTPEAAAEVEAKIAAKEPFEEVAAAYTIDPSGKQRGGYVGAFAASQFPASFAEVLQLSDGGVSKPIKSEQGWHVVKVLTTTPARQLSFEEAKGAARERLVEQRREAEVARWVNKLREASTIEVSDAGISAYQADQLRRLRDEEAARKAKAEAAKEAAEKIEAAEKAAAAEKEAAAKGAAGAPADAKSAPATPATPGQPPAPTAPAAPATPAQKPAGTP